MVTELLINGERADLLPEDFTYTLQVNNFFDLKQRQSSFSENLKLPKSPTNKRIFNYAGMEANDSVSPYNKHRTDYLVNGIPIVSNGWGFLRETDDYYNFYFQDGNIDIYRAINEMKLSDIDLSEFDHIKNPTSVINTWENDLGYVYAVADYGGIKEFNSKLNIDFLIPSIKVNWLWNKIFSLINFNFRLPDNIFDSLFITTSDSYQDVNDDSAWDEVYNNNVTIKSTLGVECATGEFIGILQVENDGENHPIMNGWNFNAPDTGFYDISIIADSVYRYHPFGFMVEDLPKIGIVKGNYTVADLQNLNLPNDLISAEDGTTLFEFEQVNINAPDSQNPYKINAQWDNIQLNAGERINFITVSDSGFSNITLSDQPDPYNNISSPSEVKVIYKLEPEIEVEQFISDLKIKDFFTELLLLKSLTPIYNKIENKYYFYTLDERLNAPAIDWSDKFVKVVSESYIIGNYARSNIFKYQYNDENDAFNDYDFRIPNEQLDDETTIDSKFYSAEEFESYFQTLGIGLPQFKMWEEEVNETESGTEIKFKEQKKHFHWLELETQGKSVTVGSQAFGGSTTTSVVKTANFDNLTFPAIFEDYYSGLKMVLNRMGLFVVEINLTELDVHNFNFFSTIYIEQLGAFFMPIRIRYKAGELTEVELIKIKK